MRNISFSAPQKLVIHWSADQEICKLTFQKIVDLFNTLFDNPVGYSIQRWNPSETRVLVDFLRYAGQCRRRQSDYAKDHAGAFVYMNCNTGHSVVFVTWYGYGEFAGSSIW